MLQMHSISQFVLTLINKFQTKEYDVRKKSISHHDFFYYICIQKTNYHT